jgi:replicative DNA helicase
MTMNSEPLPPQSPETERAVLGAMLTDQEACALAVEALHADDFYVGQHRRLFEAVCSVHDRTGIMTKALVCAALASAEACDESRFVGLVEDLAKNAASGDIEQHVACLRDRSLARKLIALGTEIVREGFAEQGVALELLGEAERRIAEFAQVRSAKTPTMQQLAATLSSRLKAGQDSANAGLLPTGYVDLDEMIGGFRPGTLAVLAGLPGTGTTMLALNMVHRIACKRGEPVGIFSPDVSADQVALLLACIGAGVDPHVWTRGRLTEAQKQLLVAEEFPRLAKAPVFVDDRPGMAMDVRLRARARLMKHRHNVRLLVFGLFPPLGCSHHSPGQMPLREEAAQICRHLRALARQLDIPILLLCDLVAKEEFRRPSLSDLNELGPIDQYADQVFLLSRPGLYEDQPVLTEPAVLIVALNHGGPTGWCNLTVKASQYRFEEYRPE